MSQNSHHRPDNVCKSVKRKKWKQRLPSAVEKHVSWNSHHRPDNVFKSVKRKSANKDCLLQSKKAKFKVLLFSHDKLSRVHQSNRKKTFNCDHTMETETLCSYLWWSLCILGLCIGLKYYLHKCFQTCCVTIIIFWDYYNEKTTISFKVYLNQKESSKYQSYASPHLFMCYQS